jgi:DNA invertase Pin-like site-specific DNA recombinase
MVADTKFYQTQLAEYAQGYRDEQLRKRNILVEQPDLVYAIYLRKSTTDESHQVRSIDDQKAACLEFADKNGLKVVAILEERQSAKEAGKREVFPQMISYIKQGKYNSILSWHPDRLSRNMKDAGEIIDLLDKGIIADLKFPSYTFVNDASGKMALGIQFVLAKQYSDSLSVNTTRGNERISEEGKYMGKSKHGYKVVDKYYRKDEKTFDVMRKAWDMALCGKSQANIQQYLAESSIDLGHSSIAKIFANPFYAGISIHGKIITNLKDVDPKFEPMVTPQEFLLLREMNKSHSSFDSTKAANILFKKFVKCQYCGRFMSSSKPTGNGGENRYLYLRCVNREHCPRYNKEEKIGNNFRGHIIMDYIIDLLSNGIEVTEDLYNKAIEQQDSDAQKAFEDISRSIITMTNTLKEHEKQRDAYSTALSKSKSNEQEESISEKINDISTMIMEVKKQIKEAESEKIKLANGINSEIVSYEDFSNFFQNASQYLQTSDNLILVDKLIRMVFSNTTIGNPEPLSYQLKEPFLSYSKLGKMQLG